MNHDEAHSCVSSNIAQAAHRCLFFAPRSSMGKLIKNHWARLIILTSACCESEELQDIDTPTANPSTRPTSRRNRRLLLAQILLRFPDQVASAQPSISVSRRFAARRWRLPCLWTGGVCSGTGCPSMGVADLRQATLASVGWTFVMTTTKLAASRSTSCS